MPIPSTQMEPGYAQTLAQIREALEVRITNATNRLPLTPTYHRGQPTPDQLPDEQLGIWLDWVSQDPDEDQTNLSTYLTHTWSIFILTRDDGNDQFGQGSDLGEATWGAIMRTLTETNVDIGLDGSCDIVPVPSARHGHGTVAGGNKRVDVLELTVATRAQAEWVRGCSDVVPDESRDAALPSTFSGGTFSG